MRYILMACLMLAGSSGWAQEAFTAKLFKSKRQVECLKSGSSDWVKVKAPYMLEEGDRIRTGKRARADIYIKYGSKIRLGANTEFTVSKVAPEGNIVKVVKGKMHAWIRKFIGRKFTVRTPSAVCAVRGTVFGVEVAEAGETTWDLFSGAIQIADNRNHTVDLQPGQRVAVAAKPEAAPPAPEPIPAEVKPPSEPATIKEEKVEIKAEEAVIKAKEEEAVKAEEAAKEEEAVEEEPAEEEPAEEEAAAEEADAEEAAVEEPVVVEEPIVTVIPTEVVEEAEEVSGSNP